MAKKTVADIDVRGRKVLLRCDFNVPLDADGNITNDVRITRAVATIKHILDGGGAVILMSHLGRPGGKCDEKLSLSPVAARLSELLGKKVDFANDCIGPEGAGEIIGGSQREDDHDVLLARIREEGLPEEAYGWYLDLRKYGTFVHSGFGLGVERTVAWICGIPHVREAIAFPRQMHRIHP